LQQARRLIQICSTALNEFWCLLQGWVQTRLTVCAEQILHDEATASWGEQSDLAVYAAGCSCS